MINYELHKCKFIISFIIFILSFQSLYFEFYKQEIGIMNFIICIVSFSFMIILINQIKSAKKLTKDFYKLCFYLFTGASAYILFNFINLITIIIIENKLILLLYNFKNFILFGFLVYFSIFTYRKIKWIWYFIN